MKKLHIVQCSLMALLMAVSGLAGCSGKNSDNNSSAVSTVSVSESSAVSETADDESSYNKTVSSADSSPAPSDNISSAAQSSEESSKETSDKTSNETSNQDSVNEETSIAPEPSSKNAEESQKVQESSQISQPSKSDEKSEPEQKPESKPEPEPVTPDIPANDNDIGGIELYNELFRIENKVSVEISIDKSETDKLQADYLKYTGINEAKKSEIYRKADLTVKVGNKSYTIDEVGIRMKGNQSLEPFYAQNGTPNICSFKLSFDETFDDKDEYGSSAKTWTDDKARKARKKRTFATLNEMDIKWNICYDNTNIREIYAAKLFESANVLVQKIGLSQLSINGNNYGLVKIYEPIDKNFLEKRLPESALGGDLYKCIWSDCNNSGKHTGRWRGATYKTDNSYGVQDNSEGIKYNFNLKTNKKSSDNESLKKFLNVMRHCNGFQ